jgi:hypothetical protein
MFLFSCVASSSQKRNLITKLASNLVTSGSLWRQMTLILSLFTNMTPWSRHHQLNMKLFYLLFNVFGNMIGICLYKSANKLKKKLIFIFIYFWWFWHLYILKAFKILILVYELIHNY